MVFVTNLDDLLHPAIPLRIQLQIGGQGHLDRVPHDQSLLFMKFKIQLQIGHQELCQDDPVLHLGVESLMDRLDGENHLD